MADQRQGFRELGGELAGARRAVSELSVQLRKLHRASRETRTRVVATCSGGTCADGAAQGSAAAGGNGLTRELTTAVSRSLASATRQALSGDFTRVLRGALSGLARGIGGLAGQRSGGGLLGGLVGNLVGGGLSLLLGKLFRRRQTVRVENTVQTEVLNFPRASNLTLAANPASRLFGGRAVARGPAFTVTVDYKQGAEDVVAAKVAGKLADLNSLQGVV